MSLSGGMDSTALLIRLLAKGYQVTCISYDYGQRHSVEIERARENIAYFQDCGIIVDHIVIDLKSAFSTIESALTCLDKQVPEGHYESVQMRQTVVPNRNAIFSSILFAHALNISSVEGVEVKVALGVHSGDHEIYPDCRPEFYDTLGQSFNIGNWGSEMVSFYLPYIDGDKASILIDALKSSDTLGLDFDTIFRNTNTSYDPDPRGRSSGKSGSDVERVLAFQRIGRIDPVEYVDGWESTLKYALDLKETHEASK